jgi:RNA 3'-phosphate cyclase
LININGSYGEGGGQILRNAVAFSVLFNEEIRINNIRANRPNAGIKPQHYTTIDIIKYISGAKTDGLKIGSSNLYFSPSKMKEGVYDFDIGTAGSIVLVFQACILSFLNTKKKIIIKLKGGTDVKWSPSWDYFENVYLQLLKKIGLSIKTELVNRGYYPKGGGEAILSIKPSIKIKPFTIKDKQEFREINGIINISNLPDHIAKRMKHACINNFIEHGFKSSIKIVSSSSLSAGTGITIWANSRDTILGKTKLGERGISAENIGDNVSKSLIDEINSGATVDINSIDQILPFLFLAENNTSSFCSVKELSGHTKTNIWLFNQFIKNDNIKIDERNNLNYIHVLGIDFLKDNI